jgi:hypothetical protein
VPNLGIRISTEGNDVKTCSDLETIVNSKYALLKGKIQGSGTKFNNGDEITVTTIPHNLGYIPFAQMHIKFSAEPWWSEIPIFRFGVAFTKCFSYCDSTNLYLIIDQFGATPETFSYKYFIYLDKGNL